MLDLGPALWGLLMMHKSRTQHVTILAMLRQRAVPSHTCRLYDAVPPTVIEIISSIPMPLGSCQRYLRCDGVNVPEYRSGSGALR